MTLAVVNDTYMDDDGYSPEPDEQTRPARLPQFEGEDVHGLRAKLTSATQLELGDDHHRLDATVRMLVTGRVTRVDHVVEERSGQLYRVETFKVVEAVEVPWDALSELMGEE